MSDSDSIFTGDSSDQETIEGKLIEDEFLDAMALHHSNLRMDFNKWMREVIIIMLNNARETKWPVGLLRVAINAAAKKHGKEQRVIKGAKESTMLTFLLAKSPAARPCQAC